MYRWTSEAKKIDEPGKSVICCRIIHLCYIICREYVLCIHSKKIATPCQLEMVNERVQFWGTWGLLTYVQIILIF